MTIFNPTSQNNRSQSHHYQPSIAHTSTPPSDMMSPNRINRATNVSLLGSARAKTSDNSFSSFFRGIADFFGSSGISELVGNVINSVRSFFSGNAPLQARTTIADLPIPQSTANSNYTTTHHVGYINGQQISSELVSNERIKDKHGKPVILQRDAMVSFEKALSQYSDIHVTSSFRTHEEQTRLYQAYLEGNNPYVVARPGYSKHQSGLALDISRHSGNQERIHEAMSQAGFHRPLPVKDPVHWVYRK